MKKGIIVGEINQSNTKLHLIFHNYMATKKLIYLFLPAVALFY